MGEPESGPNALWAEIIFWYGDLVGVPLDKSPDIWQGQSARLNDVGPFDVAINAHRETNDGIPSFGVRLTSPAYLFACFLTPSGGTMCVAGNLTEDLLIDYFKARPALAAPPKDTRNAG